MIALPLVAGTVVTFTAVWFVWSARRAWLCSQPEPQRTTVTCQVVRPIPSHRELPGRPAPAILAGRIIEPRRAHETGLASRPERGAEVTSIRLREEGMR